MPPLYYDEPMVPHGDSGLIQILNVSLAEAARRAGPWLVCRPGCTQCCYGAFAINALDVQRLRTGMNILREENPAAAQAIEDRTRAWLAAYGAGFPGNAQTGILGASEEDRQRFEDYANDAPCPALDPATGLCGVYEWRPLTCRVFGPPVRMASADHTESLAHCELCFIGATSQQVAACEMPVPHELEARLIEELGSNEETIVAFALLPSNATAP
ncbi:MAG TPA: YkgJ family cysteine cluster protein [Terracidiphilus sp.]|nr:YkgJ family cysteine cluster protein [Terracidiphilus sp.]